MKYILYILALLLVLGGAYYYIMQDASTEAPVAAELGQTFPPGTVMEDGTIDEPMGDDEFHALISYTEAGYEPREVSIKKGQTVRFVNNAASEQTWPASAVHPTHSIYPEKTANDCLGSAFDACRGLLPGEFWEFTFDSPGTWRFHDHIHAAKTGAVIVE